MPADDKTRHGRLAASALTKMANTGWLLAERGVGVVIGFFVMTLVARSLGPEQFGAYAYLGSIVALIMPLAYFGQVATLMREVVARPDDSYLLLGSSCLIMAVFALVSFALALAVVGIFGGPPGVTMGLMALFGLQILSVPAEVVPALFKAQERLAFVVLPRIAVALVVAALALYLVHQGYGLAAFAALRGGEQVAFGLAALLTFGLVIGGLFRLSASWAEVKRALRDGLPLMLSMVATVLYMRIDQIMLGQMSPPEELGRYGLAVRVADVALVVPMALSTSFFASAVRARERGTLPEQAQRLYDAMTVASVGGAVLFAVAVIILFEPIFGEAYAPGVIPTLILLTSLPFFSWSLARQTVLVAQERYWMPPLIALIGAISNVTLNLVLIPRLGGTGAAIATLLSFWITAFGVNLILPGLRGEAWRMIRAMALPSAVARLVAGMRG